jgi:hypothetical protein
MAQQAEVPLHCFTLCSGSTRRVAWCAARHETWFGRICLCQSGIKELLFGIKNFDCGVQSGSGDVLISTHDHLQFASKNRAWVIDFTTSVVRGMCMYLSVVFDWM